MNTMINGNMSKPERSALYLAMLVAFQVTAVPHDPDSATRHALADAIAFVDESQASLSQIFGLAEAINTRRFMATSESGPVRYDYESLLASCPTNSQDATRIAMGLAGCYVDSNGDWVDGPKTMDGVLVDLSGLSIDHVLADVPLPKKAAA